MQAGDQTQEHPLGESDLFVTCIGRKVVVLDKLQCNCVCVCVCVCVRFVRLFVFVCCVLCVCVCFCEFDEQ